MIHCVVSLDVSSVSGGMAAGKLSEVLFFEASVTRNDKKLVLYGILHLFYGCKTIGACASNKGYTYTVHLLKQ